MTAKERSLEIEAFLKGSSVSPALVKEIGRRVEMECRHSAEEQREACAKVIEDMQTWRAHDKRHEIADAVREATNG